MTNIYEIHERLVELWDELNDNYTVLQAENRILRGRNCWEGVNSVESPTWRDVLSMQDRWQSRIKGALQDEIEAAGRKPSTEEMQGYINGLKVALNLIESNII